jgi:hypothetical protein
MQVGVFVCGLRPTLLLPSRPFVELLLSLRGDRYYFNILQIRYIITKHQNSVHLIVIHTTSREISC